MSIIEKLTEGIMKRDVQKEGQALLGKWEKTGLMEGIESDHGRNNMACLLENQAKELLREASQMATGNVEGFAAVAFPIVRRVFGGLIANELVSVQPMSLPSGLIFFLDFTFNSTRFGNKSGESLYGGGVVGAEITGGVNLASLSASQQGFYNLNNGYASPSGTATVTAFLIASGTYETAVSGATDGIRFIQNVGGGGGGFVNTDDAVVQNNFSRLLRYDPSFISGTTTAAVYRILTASTALKLGTNNSNFNMKDLVSLVITNPANSNTTQCRWLTSLSGTDAGSFLPGTDNDNDPGIYVVFADNSGGSVANTDLDIAAACIFPVDDSLESASSLGAVVGSYAWGLENNVNIPEIDIKVDSAAITANTKKLKAKWTPELQQDINAYHNLDAEVELTGILSEQIALEIDQEILEDLIKGAKAGTYYWSRKPGKFVERTGAQGGRSVNGSLFPDFTGTVSEWYETLLETVNDVSAQIHRKTLRGGANFLVTSPEVANVMEFTSGYRADTTADENKGTAGTVKVGQISKKWDIYVDPYFPRNLVLVGRKGNSFLESGYVYAPYVPLQVTPTIFDPDDFTPRKGVMTRYGKKMVRPDMYGLVIIEDLVT